MSWMKSGTELNQFLRAFLPTLYHFLVVFVFETLFVCASDMMCVKNRNNKKLRLNTTAEIMTANQKPMTNQR